MTLRQLFYRLVGANMIEKTGQNCTWWPGSAPRHVAALATSQTARSSMRPKRLIELRNHNRRASCRWFNLARISHTDE
jgi:hypothetical protein